MQALESDRILSAIYEIFQFSEPQFPTLLNRNDGACLLEANFCEN